MKNKKSFLVIRSLALILPVIMLFMESSCTVQDNIPARLEGPGDIYDAAGTPCVAAHSTTRALYASYNGPLYQVMRQSDGKTIDIGIVSPGKNDPGGYANAAAQDAFCKNTIGWITQIYDQSGNGNHLMQAPPGTFKGPAKGGFNNLPIADMAPVTINGHKAYGVYIMPGMGLRNNNASCLAINDEPEGIYYVINGKHYDSGCCFDYGNSSTNGRAVGTGTMETTYYGTATAWGSGNGPGPWIMADMEAGLFSGYNAKHNDVPTIDSWKFVTVVVDGGGGNQWDLRGGNAQEGELTTYYSGVRPGTPQNDRYYPMSKKGGILLGNGGDNGNGSAGTFYEGIMTTGYPTETTTDAVQANIVASNYDVPKLKLSRAVSFAPNTTQKITQTFTNTTGTAIDKVRLSMDLPRGWSAKISGSKNKTETFKGPIQPGISISSSFEVTAPSSVDAGFLTGKATWKSSSSGKKQHETIVQRIRDVVPVKLNEIRLSTGNNSSNQFIELYNASSNEIDISNWSLISTPSEWASVKLTTIPDQTKLRAHGFYLLGLSSSGLVAPVDKGQQTIYVRSTEGYHAGQEIQIDGETRTITEVGTAAHPKTTLFIPVSTGPWLTFPAGTTNLPVSDASGFVKGQQIGIDFAGNYELATITEVGKAATQTTLFEAAKAGDSVIQLTANSNISVGDQLTINTGTRIELVKVKRIINVVEAPTRRFFGQSASPEPGKVELSAPLQLDHMMAVDVSCVGTGISFSPATKFEHKSGDAVQALGSGITLDKALDNKHETGTAIKNALITSSGYQGDATPNEWYGIPLSSSAGSIALMDNTGTVLIDAMVYGSQQSPSSANGTITSPEIATLEGEQIQGGCIAVAPAPARRYFFQPSPGEDFTNKSLGRYPDGNDTDSNCNDFQQQTTTTLQAESAKGSNNIKVASVANLKNGQQLVIDTGSKRETAVISEIGTTGATTIGNSTKKGDNAIVVFSVNGFSVGQAITIDSGTKLEKAVIARVAADRRRYFGNFNNTASDTITVSAPLSFAHSADVQVSGSGITLTAPLEITHDDGAQIAGSMPTPGEANLY